MTKTNNRIAIVAGAILVTVSLDQWTKALAIEHLQGQQPTYYLDKMFSLTFAKNTGAFLSLGENLGPVMKPILLNALPALLLVGLLYFIFKEKNLNRWQTMALALIVAGGLSNIIDRLLYGHVVDMLHIQLTDSLQTGIFNIADMAIMAGMFIMLPFVFQKEKPPTEAKEENNVPLAPTEGTVAELKERERE
ncbi:MAG: signal peptidase II [Lewinella sp.]|jgi:signal peptidase II|nr:signal peptidase II [Lewinella sp.]